MSFLKKPFRKIKEAASHHGSSDEYSANEAHTNGHHIPRSSVDGHGGVKNGDTNGTSGTNTPDERRRSQEIIHQEKVRRSMDREKRKMEEKRRLQLQKIESAQFLENGPEEMTKLYKPLSMNQSKRRTHENRILFRQLNFEGQ